MLLCPKCGQLAFWNNHYKVYFCSCGHHFTTDKDIEYYGHPTIDDYISKQSALDTISRNALAPIKQVYDAVKEIPSIGVPSISRNIRQSDEECVMKWLRLSKEDYFYLIEAPTIDSDKTIWDVIADRFHDGVKYRVEQYDREINENL